MMYTINLAFKLNLMVTLTDEKLIIEISHPAPEDLLIDLKDSIIKCLQHLEFDESADLEELQFAQYTLLELLKNILVK